jgi:hypothetical protein
MQSLKEALILHTEHKGALFIALVFLHGVGKNQIWWWLTWHLYQLVNFFRAFISSFLYLKFCLCICTRSDGFSTLKIRGALPIVASTASLSRRTLQTAFLSTLKPNSLVWQVRASCVCLSALLQNWAFVTG